MSGGKKDEDEIPLLLRAERSTPPSPILPMPTASERPTGMPAFDLQEFAKHHSDSPHRGVAASHVADPRIQDLADKLHWRQYDDALRVAHAILRDRPDDMVALSSIDECRTSLESLHAFSSSALMRTPSLATDGPALNTLRLDHRAGFILSLVDGHSTVSLILDMCPMSTPEALAVIFGLVQDRVLVLR
jgi:hypothetical protein